MTRSGVGEDFLFGGSGNSIMISRRSCSYSFWVLFARGEWSEVASQRMYFGCVGQIICDH